MQLLTLSSRERAAQFIQRQPHPEEFAMYRILRDGNTFYVVTYGVFSGPGAAESASRSFVGELAAIKPWIRPLRLVQDTVRATPQR
jgi:septal ring-binding cell division protein DamX